ncbi:hypothetical protein SLE2022_143780 [Rubroshorea leprosula]
MQLQLHRDGLRMRPTGGVRDQKGAVIGHGYADKDSNRQRSECGAAGTNVWMLHLMLITVVYVGLDAGFLGNVAEGCVRIQILIGLIVGDVEGDAPEGLGAFMDYVDMHSLYHLAHLSRGRDHCLFALQGLLIHRL